MFPAKRKRRYRQYLEPGSNYSVPISTEHSRKRRNLDDCKRRNDEENSTGDGMAAGTSMSQNEEIPSTPEGEETTSTSEDEDPPSQPSNQEVHENILPPSGSIPSCEIRNTLNDLSTRESDNNGIVEQLDIYVGGTQSDSSVSSTSSKPKTNYTDKYKLNDPLGCVIVTKTKFETLAMIFHIILRHGMTGKFIEDMERFVNELIGQDIIPVSKYLFNKIFEPNIQMKFHYFCEECELYFGERETFTEKVRICSNCNAKCNVHSLDGTNFFITLPLKAQLEDLAQKPGIKFLLNQSKSQPYICDLTDGIRFKELYDESDITLTFNSDGASAFETGHYSIWPIQVFVNNIPPTERYLGENLILCALWFGKKSPNFPTFLNSFYQEMNELAKVGISVKNSDGVCVKRPVFVSKCSVDSVARPKMQNCKQYNGTFGCGYCLHPGDCKVPGVTNNNARYPATQQYPLRTATSMRADMYKADELDRAGQLRKSATTKDHVNGLKGLSPLLALPKFDICHGFVIDYMHAVLLGVTSKLVDLWYKRKDDCIVDGKSLSQVDERLKALTPPNSMLSAPRPLAEHGDFKAKEFRALLYYILPCMLGILKEPYFENLRKFVTAIYILLKDCISPDELEEADSLLDSFVKEFNHLYGDVNMVYNIHLCTHLVLMVRLWGPLWAYSAFSFESGNGNLLKLISGTRGIATQLALKYSMSRTIAHSMSRNVVSSDVLDFCSDVISVSYSKKSEDYGCAKAHGEEVVKKVNREETEVLARAGFEEVSHLVHCNRVIRKGMWFYSKAYTKPAVFDDTCICLNDGRYAQIWKIVKLPNVIGLNVLIRPIRIAEVTHLATHIKTCSGDMFEPLELIRFDDVKVKCALLTVGSRSYVCDIANFYEVH